MKTNKDIQELTPLYYVRHPDDSYSVADPQPAPVAAAAMRGVPVAWDGKGIPPAGAHVLFSGDYCDGHHEGTAVVIGSGYEHTEMHDSAVAVEDLSTGQGFIVEAEDCKPVPQAARDITCFAAMQMVDHVLKHGGHTDRDVLIAGAEQYIIASMNKSYAAGVRDTRELLAAQPSPAQVDVLSQEAKPIAYLRFRAAQQWSGIGGHDIEHAEWYETCHAHEVGDDKQPAFPVYAAPHSQTMHSDDVAVDRFAVAMKVKMAVSRVKGRSGWDDESRCSESTLARMLVEHVAKGDPVDIANFAMMLHQREAAAVEHHPYNGGQARRAIAAAAAPPSQPVLTDAINLIVRDVAELDYSSDTVLDLMQVSEADLRAIIQRHIAAASTQADSKEGV